MAKATKAIINKHIDNSTQLTNDKFVSELEKAKGEIIICNDPENPTIYIMDTQGNPKKISGGGGGVTTSNYEVELKRQLKSYKREELVVLQLLKLILLLQV